MSNNIKKLNDLSVWLKEAELHSESDEVTSLLKEASWLDWGQAALDIIGLVPGFGEPFDAANAAISVIRNKPVQAILSAISMIPVYGDAIGKGGKVLLHAINGGLQTAKWGAKTYTVGSLAQFVNDKIKEVPDSDIEKILNEVDRQTGQRKGTMHGIYINKIKLPIEEASKAA